MTRDPEEKAIEKIIEEIGSPLPNLPETKPTAQEIFSSLSLEEQDEILKLIIAKGGIGRLLSIIHSGDTPGALELFLDRIHYYHFLRLVEGQDL